MLNENYIVKIKKNLKSRLNIKKYIIKSFFDRGLLLNCLTININSTDRYQKMVSFDRYLDSLLN